MTAQDASQNKLLQWWIGLLYKLSPTLAQSLVGPDALLGVTSAKESAKNRLKLVLLHDRTKLSPSLMESMRDELVQVIAKYVEIDQSTLDLCLEQEANTIALVANISVIRSKEVSSS